MNRPAVPSKHVIAIRVVGVVVKRYSLSPPWVHGRCSCHGDEIDEGAEDFFQRVMEETNTQITWPSKLKIGAKSKKDPHIKVIGFPENVSAAKNKIMTVLDTKSNKVTLKMDVSHTEHSHVIGKGGNNIKRVMTETNCHIHFPDSNRGNNNSEKSNQVSLAGQPEGVESARKQIRDLLPLVFMFDLPVTSPLTPVPDVNSPYIQQLQQTHAVTINFKQRVRSYSTTAVIRGSVYSAKGVQQATTRLMERLAGNVNLPVSMQLEIAPQHHIFIIGRGGVNIKHIMQATGANILFPDPNSATQQRKGTVFITGTIDSVILARQHLIGCLPLVLMFDVKENIELDQARVTQLMEQLDVYISVKPKPRQPSKSVIVKSIERNASNMYLARQVLLGLKSDIKISTLQLQTAELKKEAGLINPSPLSVSGIGVLGPSVLSVNTANFIISGHPTPSVITSPHYTTNHITPASPWIHSAPSPTVYSPIMVVTPGTTSTLPALDLVHSPHTVVAGTNGYHQDLANAAVAVGTTTTTNATIRIPTPLEHAGPPSNATSDSASPPHSPPPCVSPITVGLCNAAADLVKLQKDGALGEVLSPKHSPALTRSAVINNHLHQHHLQQQQQQQQQYLSQQHHQYFSHHHHHQHHPSPHPSHPSQYHDDMSSTLHSLKLLGLNKTSSLTQLSSLAQQSSSHHTSIFNGVGLLNSTPVRDSPSPPEHDLSEKLAPGIERKNSTSSLFSSPLQFGFDYEQKKLLAMKAMQKKPEGESRIPTDIWSGMGFSKSMPESAIRDKLGQMGLGTRCMESGIMGYESPRPEIDLTIDQDLWNDDHHDTQPDRTPGLPSRLLNKAPGEYPSPRKKITYGLSHSNHVDSASLPQNKSVWATKTDLAELFSALGLSKYTDLFQQQEIDLSTFLTLSDHDLRELGISTFGARRKMLLAIADLNKRRTLIPSPATKPDSPPSVSVMGSAGSSGSLRHSPVYPSPNSADSSGGGLLRGGGNSASELFPSPNPPSALMNTRGGPGLGSSSGHW